MLAVRWENPNPNTWRFYLRRGAKFHNGDALTAEDVKFTSRPSSPTRAPSTLYLGPTEGARVIDPYTVEITTKTPFPPLLHNLTRMHILPVAYDELGADQFAAKKPIGSGPYRFVEWQRGQRIVLDVNADYWAGPPHSQAARLPLHR